MATVPPADRTSPALDPRYDPAFQRGYRAAGRLAEPRPSAPAPPAPVSEVVDEGTGAARGHRTARARTGILWLVSTVLVAVGIVLHFAFGAAEYGADWSVSTEAGAIRFADGRSIEQVLAGRLAVAVAPYLVALGIATGVATLFVSILRPERGTR